MADEDATIEEAESGDAPVLPGDGHPDTPSPTSVVHAEYRKLVCEDCAAYRCDTCYNTGYYAALSHPAAREIAKLRAIVELAKLSCLDHSCTLEGWDDTCPECRLAKALWEMDHA